MSYDDDKEMVERKCSVDWRDRVTWETAMRWLNQFEEEDRTFAVKLLKHFQFYSYGKVLDLLAILHSTLLKEHLLAPHFSGGQGTVEERDAVYRSELRNTAFLCITSSATPKSGQQLLYMYKSINNLPGSLFTTASELANELTRRTVRTVVLVDDFLGTGIQALTFYADHLKPIVEKCGGNIKVLLLVCVALADGVQYVEAQSPIRVLAGEILEEDAKAFSPASRVFEDLDLGEAEQRIRRYGERLDPYYPLGYGHCQLLIGFHWFPPDNTITPIWWANTPTSWTPVFARPREEEI